MSMNTPFYPDALEHLHHPPMTLIEEGLKSCWEMRKDLHGRVLTGSEMAEYMLWMVENFGENSDAALEQAVIPAMLQGGGISGIGHEILRDSHNAGARKALSQLYESPQEAQFFLENQDISTGVFLRYLPAYWRRDEYFEIYYVFSGSCTVTFSQETIVLRPGSVLIVPPDVPKACTCPEDDCMVHFFMIRKSTFSQVFWSHFSSRNLMSNFFQQALNGESRTPYLRFETGQDLRIEGLLYTISQEYGKSRKYSAQLINSFMSSFFLCLLQEYEETAQISRYSNLTWKSEFAAILEDIQNNYRNVTLEGLAEKYGYSRRQLIRIIQGCTGRNFTELQTSLRMEKAARMLTAGTASVERIALELGFSDRSSFYRAFGKYFGCTPGEYMRTN